MIIGRRARSEKLTGKRQTGLYDSELAQIIKRTRAQLDTQGFHTLTLCDNEHKKLTYQI